MMTAAVFSTSDLQAQMPMGVSKRFRRAISPPPPGGPSTRSQILPFQAQSSLLTKLPAEVRQMIWKEALGGQVLHIVRKKKNKVRHKVRTRPVFIWDFKELDLYGEDRILANWSLVSLLLTCRQVYNETIDILYMANTFHIEHPWTFLFLYEIVLPHRWESIRKLELTWTFLHCWHVGSSRLYACESGPEDYNTWEVVCSKIMEMTSLDSFVLILDINWCDENAFIGLHVSHGLAATKGIEHLLSPLQDLQLASGNPWMIQIPIWYLYYADVPIKHRRLERRLRAAGFDCRVMVPTRRQLFLH